MSIEALKNFITSRIENISGEINKSAQTVTQVSANHHYLSGMLAEAKLILDSLNSLHLPGTVGSVINALDRMVDVASPVSNAVNTVQDGINTVENAL
jgi:hypothetical protein